MGKTGIRRRIKAHKEVMELENIIDSIGAAMRGAYLPYVAESGRLTPKIEWELERFRWFAMKVTGVKRVR